MRKETENNQTLATGATRKNGEETRVTVAEGATGIDGGEAQVVAAEGAAPRTERRFVGDAWSAHRVKRGALLYWAALLTLSAASMHGVALVKALPPSALLAILLLVFTLVQIGVAALVVALPARRLLLVAGLLDAVGVLVWFVAHAWGLPDGFALWRAETLWVPDLYLPVVEGLAAGFFLCLWGRTWQVKHGFLRALLRFLPLLLILALLVALALKSIVAVVFFLVPGVLFTSLEYIFLPIVGLLALFLILRQIMRPLRRRTPGAWRTTFTVLPALLLLTLVTWGGSMSASVAAWLSTSTPISVPAGQTATLMYCNAANGNPLALDLSEPSAQASRPAPVFIFIHGGETLVGSRILDDGSLEDSYMVQMRSELLARGFVFASLDYGLAPLYSTGEQVAQSKCAVRFLRAHASQLGIDPGRVGVGGQSQGGYISAMLGTLGPDARFDVGQYLDQSSRVQAVVDMWGPTDISNFSGSPSWVALIVGHASTAQLRSVSPLYHVAAGDPPFLIMYGTDDWFIAPHHSQDLAKRLQAAGVPVTLVPILHDGHGLAAPSASQTEQPSPDTLVHMIVAFCARTLA